MKKNELEKIIKYRKILLERNNLLHCNFDDYNILKINELKKDFDILKLEIDKEKKKHDEAINFFNNYKCEHNIRICDFNEDKCIICGSTMIRSSLSKYNCIELAHTKNKKIATFIGYEYLTQNGFFNEEYTRYYKESDIFKILENIIKKNSNDEIDIVDEIEKLDFNKCVINKPKNTKLVLMIIDSNYEYINKYTYISNTNDINYKEIINYFSNLYNVSIEVLTNNNELSNIYKKDNIFITKYNTLNDLESLLKVYNYIPFDLIINMSSLVKLSNNNIETFNLDLKKYFKNSRIINVKDLSKEHNQDFHKYLDNNEIYGYYKNNFYYLKDNNIYQDNCNNFCDKAKRLIKK